MRRYGQDRIVQETVALLEHIEIYRLLQRHKRKASGKRITLDALLKEQNLSV